MELHDVKGNVGLTRTWLKRTSESTLEMIDWLIAEVDRLATANADLQQRLDAAEEALKVAQGEIKVLHSHFQDECGDCMVVQQLEAEASKAAHDLTNSELEGHDLAKMLAAGESTLTAANSRVEQLREALERIAEIRSTDWYGNRTPILAAIMAQKALADDAKVDEGPCDFSFPCSDYHEKCQASHDKVKAEIARSDARLDRMLAAVRKIAGQRDALQSETTRLESEIGSCYEVMAALYAKVSAKPYHMSDCATSGSPAERPGPCNCLAPSHPSKLNDILTKISDAAGQPSHCLNCEAVWEIINEAQKVADDAKEGM